MTNDGTTLFERLGGDAAVADMVGDFYGRVFADPVLRPFFESTDHEKLVRMQAEFFVAALGGPPSSSITTLSEVHAGRGIEAQHLARFTDHLMATLRDRGVDPEAVDQVVARIAMHADEIVGGVTEDG